MSETMYVGVQDFRKSSLGDTRCVGLWREKAAAIKELNERFMVCEDFSDPACEEPYWGSEDWTVTLFTEEVK